MKPRDLIGPLPRALYGLAAEHHGLVLDVVNHLKGNDADFVHRCVAEALRQKPAASQELVELPPLLVFDDAHVASVDLSRPQDPQKFWQTTKESPARYLWGLFPMHVVAHAVPIQSAGIVGVPYTDLPRNASGREVLKSPKLGDFNPSTLCPIIAEMISKQPNGESGDLLNDGRANLFKCGLVLVLVRWLGVHRGWSVDGWNPGLEVAAGRRVFSGNLIV